MKTTRRLLAFACLAVLPVWSYGSDPQPPAATAQEKQAPPAAPPESRSGKSAAPSVAVTDPAKMAAPSSVPGAKPPGAGAVDEKSYIIGPEDVLGILVWGNQSLTTPAMVRSDGRITVGLIGEVMAAGQTPEKLSQEITQRLKEGGFIRSPQVTVSVNQINSKTYFIQGEVNKPGRYPLIVPITALEALVNAGGFRDFANKKDIRIIRGDKQFKFNYTQVIKGKNREQNIYLLPGDLIVVK